MNVVLDTNVLFSALLSRGGTCDRILHMVLEGRIQACVSPAILAEYEMVLTRPFPGFPVAEAAEVLVFLGDASYHVTPQPLNVELPDRRDLPFLETAAVAGAVLITGNERHFPRPARAGVIVVSPRQFLDLLFEGPQAG